MHFVKFTIVTIAYNAENEIEDTLNSVLQQDYKYIEYIIVDGKSEDHTNEIIKKYIPQLVNRGIEIQYTSEKDAGISDAFNKGIKKATGDVIGLINAGDCLLPGALKKINEIFDDSVDILYGKTLCIDKKYGLKYLRKIPDNLDLGRMKYDGLIFTHQSAFVRKSVYDKHGLYDISFKYVMDTDLFVKFYQEGIQFKYVDEVLVSMQAGGISSKASYALLKENIRIGEKYEGYSKAELYRKWICGVPRRIVVKFAKHFPKFWYEMIGEERRWKDES